MTEEQCRQTACIADRMQRDFRDGLLTQSSGCWRRRRVPVGVRAMPAPRCGHNGVKVLEPRRPAQLVADPSARREQHRGITRASRRHAVRHRVVFTPWTDHYEFTGSWTSGKLVSGVVDLPQCMASPSVLSWNTIHAWLRELALLEGALDSFA